jgi:hypothetical protein
MSIEIFLSTSIENFLSTSIENFLSTSIEIFVICGPTHFITAPLVIFIFAEGEADWDLQELRGVDVRLRRPHDLGGGGAPEDGG